MCVELCNEFDNVSAVNDASFFEAFHTGSGAAEAVHTDFEEIDCRRGVKIKNIANDAFSGNFHCDTKPFYFNFNDRLKTVLFSDASKIFRNNIILSYPFFDVNIFFCKPFFVSKKGWKTSTIITKKSSMKISLKGEIL